MLNDHHCCLLFISRCKFCVNLKMINSVLYIFSCTHWSFMSWLRISLGWEAYIPAAGLFICWGWYTGTVSVQCTVVRSVSASRPGYHHSVTLSRLPWIRSQSSWHIFLWFRNTRSLKDAQIFINKARRINMNINNLHGCEQFFNRIKLHVLYLTTQLLISLSSAVWRSYLTHLCPGAENAATSSNIIWYIINLQRKLSAMISVHIWWFLHDQTQFSNDPSENIQSDTSIILTPLSAYNPVLSMIHPATYLRILLTLLLTRKILLRLLIILIVSSWSRCSRKAGSSLSCLQTLQSSSSSRK